jgi:hypothetical protein
LVLNPRFAAFNLPALSVAEARNQHRDLLRRLAAAGDALWIAELTDSLAERNRRAILGAVNAPGEEASVSRGSFPLTARAVRMVERVSGKASSPQGISLLADLYSPWGYDELEFLRYSNRQLGPIGADAGQPCGVPPFRRLCARVRIFLPASLIGVAD